MVRKAKNTLLLGIFIFTVGLMAWPSCAIAPIPAKRTQIGTLKASTFTIPKSEKPTRDEILQKFGQPDTDDSELRLITYHFNTVTRRKVWLCFFVIPFNVQHDASYFDVAYFQFDENNRLKRSGIWTKGQNDNPKKWL